MSHIPYGYRIYNGKAAIEEDEARQVKKLFSSYLSGLSLIKAAEKAGIKKCHAAVALMLENSKYIGDEFYPRIIDKETFEKVAEERSKRAKQLGKLKEPKLEPVNSKLKFKFVKPKQKFEDPFRQAENLYGCIENEVREYDGE